MMNSKKTTILYWASTALLAAVFLMSGGIATFSGPDYADRIVELGYPRYVPLYHGPFKLIGAIILLIPRRFVFKHWAYAGVVFTLFFAVLAHASKSEPYLPQLMILLLAAFSYYMYVKKMKLKELTLS